MTAVLTDLFTLRSVTTAGAIGVPLAEFSSCSVSSVLNTVGGMNLEYSRAAVNAAEAVVGREVALLRNGAELANCRFFLEDEGENLVDDNEDASTISFSGRSFLCTLEDAIVYPISYPVNDPPYHKFLNATAGAILGTLISKAQTRGVAFRGMTFTFTNNVDSNGVAWNQAITIQYDGGVSLLTVLENLVSQGICDVETVGRELKLYNAGTLERHLETGANAIVFRKGRDLKDAPNKRTLRNLGTVGLIGGAENVYVEYVDTAAVNTWGRREKWFSQGGISDTTTLGTVVQHEINLVKDPKLERTHGTLFYADGAPQPFVDYRLGDWCGSDVGRGTVDVYRIRQINLEFDNQGLLTDGQVVLNDLFAEREAALSRRIDGIINGTTITGSSNSSAGPDSDLVGPNPPTSLSASGAFDYMQQLVSITFNWVKPPLNTDGTAYLDHDQYHVRWKYVSDADFTHGTLSTQVEHITFGGVEPNRAITLQVRAVDKNGNASTWAQWDGASPTDTIAPPTPSAPQLSGVMGYLRVWWNGLGSANQGMPSDFAYVEVHSDNSDNFTCTSATKRDIIPSGAGASLISASYTALTYVRFVAVDRQGNKSSASATASGLATQVIAADVFDGAIGSAKLADLAVTTAKIKDLAVIDAKIGSMDVGKITAGTITADVIMGSSFRTGTSGARAEFGPYGFRTYDSGGVLTIQLKSSDGSGVFKGTVTAGEISGYIRSYNTVLNQEIGLITSPNPALYMDTHRAWQKGPGYVATGFTTPNLGVTTILQSPSMWLRQNSGANVLDQTVCQATVYGAGAQIDGSDGASFTTGSFTCYFPTNDKLGNQLRSYMAMESDYSSTAAWEDQNNWPALVYYVPQLSPANANVGLRAQKAGNNLILGVVENYGATFGDFWYRSLVNPSASSLKTDFSDLTVDPIQVILDNPSWRWRWRDRENEFNFGPVADNLPEEISDGEHVKVNSMIGLMWAAIAQLAKEVRGDRAT